MKQLGVVTWTVITLLAYFQHLHDLSLFLTTMLGNYIGYEVGSEIGTQQEKKPIAKNDNRPPKMTTDLR